MIYEENPLHVEMVPTLVPVAREVQDEIRINVAGEPVIDPKRDSVQSNETRKTKCENAFDLAYLVFLLLVLVGIFGAFIMFLVWMSKPDVFGKNSNNY